MPNVIEAGWGWHIVEQSMKRHVGATSAMVANGANAIFQEVRVTMVLFLDD
jgi:hypothetical protein